MVKMVLELGCGSRPALVPPGVELVTTDIIIRSSEVRPTVLCDLSRGWPFRDGVFDLVYSCHFLEHLAFSDVNYVVMPETCRVLKRGGEVEIIVPNIKRAAQRLLKDENDPIAWVLIYGVPDDSYSYHKWGCTKTNMTKLLEDHKFTDITVEEKYDDLYVSAKKYGW